MPDSTYIRVPTRVYKVITAIRKEGSTNMLHHVAVADMAEALGEHETAQWIHDNRRLYAQGIMHGMEPDENNHRPKG